MNGEEAVSHHTPSIHRSYVTPKLRGVITSNEKEPSVL